MPALLLWCDGRAAVLSCYSVQYACPIAVVRRSRCSLNVLQRSVCLPYCCGATVALQSYCVATAAAAACFNRRLMRLLFYFVRSVLWTFVTSYRHKVCYFLFLSPFTRHWPAVSAVATAGLFNIPLLRHVTPCSWQKGFKFSKEHSALVFKIYWRYYLSKRRETLA